MMVRYGYGSTVLSGTYGSTVQVRRTASKTGGTQEMMCDDDVP